MNIDVWPYLSNKQMIMMTDCIYLTNAWLWFFAYPQAEIAAICPMMSIQARRKAGSSPIKLNKATTGWPPFNPRIKYCLKKCFLILQWQRVKFRKKNISVKHYLGWRVHSWAFMGIHRHQTMAFLMNQHYETLLDLGIVKNIRRKLEFIIDIIDPSQG